MKTTLKRYFNLFIGLMPALLPAIARADSFGGDSNFDLTAILGKLSALLSGSIGGAILVLALMFVGYLWLAKGAMPKDKALAWMGGASLIFGANYFYNYIWGQH